MLIYYTLILIILVLGLRCNNEKNKKRYVIFICILLSLVSGLRHYTIGNDTSIYLNGFNNMLYYGKNYFNISRLEIGYNIIVFLFTRISDNFNLYLFVLSLFINLLIGNLIIKHSKNISFSLILFIICRFFFSEMNVIRQMLAVAIIAYSINKASR